MTTDRIYLTSHNLEIGYKNKGSVNLLFSNLNLSLKAGELICFMGPNGAGKSTLLRTLAGLQKPLAGSVTFDASIANGRRERMVAIVLTDPVRSANLTVGEVVAFGRYPYIAWNISLTTRDLALINSSIEQAHIQPLLNKKIFELSDGQLQMVMIARALAQDTPIIMLDEPTAHLDLNNRLEIMNVLRELARTTKKAILVATHELDLALQTADHIWLTGKDRDIIEGCPEDLVLNGSFDNIFQFKGFDLKTGKVRHHPFRNVLVGLTGEGPVYLWTKNALERNGYSVAAANPGILIEVIGDFPSLKWVLEKDGTKIELSSIEKLLKSL